MNAPMNAALQTKRSSNAIPDPTEELEHMSLVGRGSFLWSQTRRRMVDPDKQRYSAVKLDVS